MKRSFRAPMPLSVSNKEKAGCSNLGCGLFALPFLLAGAFVIYIIIVGPALNIYAAQDWTPTPCTIESIRVAGDETYSVDIVYKYTINGVEYRSDQYDFSKASTSAYDNKYEAVKRNPPGSTGTCYVNPDNPAESVFNRDFSSDIWFGLFGLPFFLAGVFGLYVAIRNALKAKKKPDAPESKQANAWPGFETIRYRNPSPTAQDETELQPPPFEAPSFSETPFEESSFFHRPAAQEPAVPGPVSAVAPVVPVAAPAPANPFERNVLQPQFSPGCKVKTMAVIAVVWNLVVWAFGGWDVKGSWNDNVFGLIPSLFFSPFELIGLFLIGLTGYFFLGLFNPRPRLILSTKQVRLGEPFNVEWEFTRSTRAVKHFYLYLEGCEMATYRRGTNSHTDKSVFAKINIADRPAASSGGAQVTVPANTMHTFTSENNKIVWTIQLRGDIRVWPDVSESFEIEVLPGRSLNAGER